MNNRTILFVALTLSSMLLDSSRAFAIGAESPRGPNCVEPRHSPYFSHIRVCNEAEIASINERRIIELKVVGFFLLVAIVFMLTLISVHFLDWLWWDVISPYLKKAGSLLPWVVSAVLLCGPVAHAAPTDYMSSFDRGYDISYTGLLFSFIGFAALLYVIIRLDFWWAENDHPLLDKLFGAHQDDLSD